MLLNSETRLWHQSSGTADVWAIRIRGDYQVGWIRWLCKGQLLYNRAKFFPLACHHCLDEHVWAKISSLEKARILAYPSARSVWSPWLLQNLLCEWKTEVTGSHILYTSLGGFPRMEIYWLCEHSGLWRYASLLVKVFYSMRCRQYDYEEEDDSPSHCCCNCNLGRYSVVYYHCILLYPCSGCHYYLWSLR